MKITVTKKDIEKGMKDEMDRCPVAFAIKRRLKKRTGIDVGTRFVYYSAKKTQLPKVARNFIFKFDHNEEVKPFSFNLKLK